MFLIANSKFLSNSFKSINKAFSSFNSLILEARSFVFGEESFASSIIINSSFLTFAERACLRPSVRIFLGSLVE